MTIFLLGNKDQQSYVVQLLYILIVVYRVTYLPGRYYITYLLLL